MLASALLSANKLEREFKFAKELGFKFKFEGGSTL